MTDTVPPSVFAKASRAPLGRAGSGRIGAERRRVRGGNFAVHERARPRRTPLALGAPHRAEYVGPRDRVARIACRQSFQEIDRSREIPGMAPYSLVEARRWEN